MGLPFRVRLSDAQDAFLEMESEKRKVPQSQILREILESFMKGEPFITSLTDIDLKLKQEKLNHEVEKKAKTIEQTRRLKNDNEFFDKHGYYPTKPTNYVKEVVAEQRQPQKTWHGSGYVSEEIVRGTVEFKAPTPAIPAKEPSLEQLERVYDNLTNILTSGKFSCNECAQIFENRDEIKSHFHKHHASVMAKLIREVFH